MNPLEIAVELATQEVLDLREVFTSIGIGNPGIGVIPQAYTTAQNALRAIVDRSRTLGGSRYALAEIMALGKTLERAVSGHSERVLSQSVSFGYQNARLQLRAYNDPYRSPDPDLSVTAAVEAVVTQTHSQVATLYALAASDAAPDLMTGTAEREGPLRESAPLYQLANWVVFMAGAAFLLGVGAGRGGGAVYQKMAVAALDHRTTPCCLAVHGQVQPLERPFHLTQPPAFAPYIDHPPFHAYCRTAIALYREEYDTGVTQRMRDSAEVILAERAAGGSGYRHPASALV